jgi:diguanylate cyclase (GGDEF)-like protein
MTERLIELGLRQRDNSRPIDANATSSLACLNSRLLALVGDTALESETLDTNQFRAKLESYRVKLENGVDGDPATTATANECLLLIQDYLARAHRYLLDRENEFAQVIDIMRLALSKLTGDANAFNVRLIGSSERLNRLTELEDIRELKKKIAQEVQGLNRLVHEKQKQDELQYAKLALRIEVLQQKLTNSKWEASVDPLTRVSNRRYFDETIERWITTHKEIRRPFVLALLDVDNFKEINDAHGHQIGDRVLYCVGQWLAQSVRSNDVLARYGGEEFVALLEDMSVSDAESKFAEILAGMSNCSYAFDKDGQEHTVTFTASCGLAEFNFEESGEDLLRRADEALFAAKRTGKNRVVLAKVERSLWKSLLPRSNKPKS